MIPLVIASHNEGKVREIRELLAPLHYEAISASALGLPEPEETGLTFADNARIKSQSAAALSGNYALADDSGLCVKALGDAPGIYSARWAGPTRDFTVAMRRICVELAAKGQKPEGQEAYFICMLSLTTPAGETFQFEGRVQGRLTFPPRGDHGFGYDPIFIAEGRNETFAQMQPAAKHAISHRAKAFEKFLAHLQALKEAS